MWLNLGRSVLSREEEARYNHSAGYASPEPYKSAAPPGIGEETHHRADAAAPDIESGAIAAEIEVAALSDIEIGEMLEVIILSPIQWRDSWVACRVSAVHQDGTVDIHVMPTREYGNAAGASDTSISAVDRNHLRRAGASAPLAAARADAEWAVEGTRVARVGTTPDSTPGPTRSGAASGEMPRRTLCHRCSIAIVAVTDLFACLADCACFLLLGPALFVLGMYCFSTSSSAHSESYGVAVVGVSVGVCWILSCCLGSCFHVVYWVFDYGLRAAILVDRVCCRGRCAAIARQNRGQRPQQLQIECPACGFLTAIGSNVAHETRQTSRCVMCSAALFTESGTPIVQVRVVVHARAHAHIALPLRVDECVTASRSRARSARAR
jgi:hypothetical protein